MEIQQIDIVRDGGTLMIETSEGVFYIDNRISTKTKGQVYDRYPLHGKLVSDEISTKLLTAIEEFKKNRQWNFGRMV